MNWFAGLGLRRAAKRYAHQLGPELVRSYGASPHYTPAQLRAAVSRLGLNPRYLALAYARFLAEEQFLREVIGHELGLDYSAARKLYRRFSPHGLLSASGEPADSIGAAGADYSAFDSH